MTTYIALLRAVNVGGTGKLPMAELKAICQSLGFTEVETYIASGNVVFRSGKTPTKVKSELETAVADHMGKAIGVVVRTAEELSGILAAHPFPEAPGNRTVVIFLDEPPPRDTLDVLKRLRNEEVRCGGREIHVHYPDGIGVSKLIIPAAKSGTARNRNTVEQLARIAGRI